MYIQKKFIYIKIYMYILKMNEEIGRKIMEVGGGEKVLKREDRGFKIGERQ